MIPLRLIQTAKHRDLALRQQAFAANLRLLNPQHKWCFFDNEDVDRFVAREFPEYRPVFEAFALPIQRYDFFRYLAVYRLGGFYFDLDVLLARDLTPLHAHDCVFPFEGLTFSRLLRRSGMDWEIGNYAFGAAPGHPFLAAVIENCARAQRDPSWLTAMMDGVPTLSRREHYVLYSTGPGILSRTLAENPQLAKTVTVLFPHNVCDRASWNTFGEFGVHLMDGSWRPDVSFIRRKLAQRCEDWATRRIVRQSQRLGTSRRLLVATVAD
jgi:inositol phosphorylceramide mannosyltransferase catalytic subunit